MILVQALTNTQPLIVLYDGTGRPLDGLHGFFGR